MDSVAHVPPMLGPEPGSLNVTIGGQPAWRGVPGAVATGLQIAKAASDATIKAAESAATAAKGTPGAPAAQAAAMGAAISAAAAAAGADKHICATPLPVPPHGTGVVIDSSATVLINNAPACRMGDTVLEAVVPPNKIVKGCTTVIMWGNRTILYSFSQKLTTLKGCVATGKS